MNEYEKIKLVVKHATTDVDDIVNETINDLLELCNKLNFTISEFSSHRELILRSGSCICETTDEVRNCQEELEFSTSLVRVNVTFDTVKLIKDKINEKWTLMIEGDDVDISMKVANILYVSVEDCCIEMLDGVVLQFDSISER